MSDMIAVRRNVPPVNTRHLRRLPAELQARTRPGPRTNSARTPLAEARRRARRVAFTLLEQGDEPDHVERVLHTMGFHPALCHESAHWAYQRHCEALDHVQGVQVRTRLVTTTVPPDRGRLAPVLPAASSGAPHRPRGAPLATEFPAVLIRSSEDPPAGATGSVPPPARRRTRPRRSRAPRGARTASAQPGAGCRPSRRRRN